MKAQAVQFAVTTKDKVVAKIGRAAMEQPKTRFNGKGIIWYEDKPKAK